jgi:hypothetical protein
MSCNAGFRPVALRPSLSAGLPFSGNSIIGRIGEKVRIGDRNLRVVKWPSGRVARGKIKYRWERGD